jgi:hypothetical protein
MSKMSVLAKGTVLAILIALVLSSFPTASVFAGSNTKNLEDKWDQLVTNFNKQSITHNGAHRWVENWLKTNKNTSASEKAEVRRHLSVCNSALMSAQVIVSSRAGFDAKGKVLDKALAIKSIKDLAYYLRQHASSVQNILEHSKK